MDKSVKVPCYRAIGVTTTWLEETVLYGRLRNSAVVQRAIACVLGRMRNVLLDRQRRDSGAQQFL